MQQAKVVFNPVLMRNSLIACSLFQMLNRAHMIQEMSMKEMTLFNVQQVSIRISTTKFLFCRCTFVTIATSSGNYLARHASDKDVWQYAQSSYN